MRQVLIDWLIDVHRKFKMKAETLFICSNIIDRYLELHLVSRNNLQLLGISAMNIAAKYEEIYPPEMKDFVMICDGAYKKE